MTGDGVVGPVTWGVLLGGEREPAAPAKSGPGFERLASAGPPPPSPKSDPCEKRSFGPTSRGDAIFFATDSNKLEVKDREVLDGFVERQQGNLASRQFKVVVIGFADQRFTDHYIQQLSDRGAASVFGYLEGKVPGGLPEGSDFSGGVRSGASPIAPLWRTLGEPRCTWWRSTYRCHLTNLTNHPALRRNEIAVPAHRSSHLHRARSSKRQEPATGKEAGTSGRVPAVRYRGSRVQSLVSRISSAIASRSFRSRIGHR